MNTEKSADRETVLSRSFKSVPKIILENKETGIYEHENNYNRRYEFAPEFDYTKGKWKK